MLDWWSSSTLSAAAAVELGCWAVQLNTFFAAKSDAELEGVCIALQDSFELPPFEFDSHDTWRYAWSENAAMRLNVTQAEDDRTVETWMAGCPSGVNYQVILTAGSEPPGFASRLCDVLGSEVVRYASVPSAGA